MSCYRYRYFGDARQSKQLQEQEYKKSLAQMLEAKLQWCRRFPFRDARIVFNFSPNVMVIAPISEAIRLKIVTTNAAGAELLECLKRAVPVEPTVLMVRAVLEVGE